MVSACGHGARLGALQRSYAVLEGCRCISNPEPSNPNSITCSRPVQLLEPQLQVDLLVQRR